MTKSSNNKIACIFEDISFRTHVIQTFSSCFDQYFLLSKYVTLFFRHPVYIALESCDNEK